MREERGVVAGFTRGAGVAVGTAAGRMTDYRACERLSLRNTAVGGACNVQFFPVGAPRPVIDPVENYT